MGGGSSVSYPEHILNMHEAWLSGQDMSDESWSGHGNYCNVADDILAARRATGGSPFANVLAYNPDSQLDMAQEKLDEFLNEVLQIAPQDDVEAAIDAVAAKLENAMDYTDEIDAVVNNAEARSIAEMQRAVSRFAAGMFDLNAVMTTQFTTGIALLEQARASSVSDLEMRLHLQAKQERSTALVPLVAAILERSTQKAKGLQSVAALQGEFSKQYVVAKNEQLAMDLEMELKDATWDLDLYKYGISMLGAPAGTAAIPAPEPWEKALGALSTIGSLLIGGLGLLL